MVGPFIEGTESIEDSGGTKEEEEPLETDEEEEGTSESVLRPGEEER